MKSLGILLVMIFYLTIVCGRNLQEFDFKDGGDLDVENNGRDHANQMRHRRRSRQSFYYPHYYLNDRRDYDDRRDYYSRTQDEMLSKILNQLEEIVSYIKKPPAPPSPPQIFYIPVPYPVPQYTIKPINPPKKGVNITLDKRWPEMDDENQNWGLVAEDTGEESFIGDGSRPINLEPIESNEPTVKPPAVEHGSVQAGMTTTTVRPSPKGSPGRCKAAILVCCQYGDNQDKQDCFEKYGCIKTFSTGITCLPEIVKRVIDEFSETYAPINNA